MFFPGEWFFLSIANDIRIPGKAQDEIHYCLLVKWLPNSSWMLCKKTLSAFGIAVPLNFGSGILEAVQYCQSAIKSPISDISSFIPASYIADHVFFILLLEEVNPKKTFSHPWRKSNFSIPPSPHPPILSNPVSLPAFFCHKKSIFPKDRVLHADLLP